MLPSARLRSLIAAILCPFRVDTVNIHSTTGHFAPLVALLCLARVSAVCGMFLLFLKLAWSGFKSLSGHHEESAGYQRLPALLRNTCQHFLSTWVTLVDALLTLKK